MSLKIDHFSPLCENRAACFQFGGDKNVAQGQNKAVRVWWPVSAKHNNKLIKTKKNTKQQSRKSSNKTKSTIANLENLFLNLALCFRYCGQVFFFKLAIVFFFLLPCFNFSEFGVEFWFGNVFCTYGPLKIGRDWRDGLHDSYLYTSAVPPGLSNRRN